MMIPDGLLVYGLERRACLSADWKRLFRHRENSRADNQKVLLVDAMTRRRSLRQGLRHLPGFKGSSPQALRRSLIVARSSSSVEGPVNGLCYRPPNLSRLERS